MSGAYDKIQSHTVSRKTSLLAMRCVGRRISPGTEIKISHVTILIIHSKVDIPEIGICCNDQAMIHGQEDAPFLTISGMIVSH